MRHELRREAARAPMVRNVRTRALGIRGWSRKARRKKNRRKPPGKQTCRPPSRSPSRTSSRSPSPSPSRSASQSRSRSRTESLGQSASPAASADTPPPRKSRSRSPLSRPRSRNRSVASETAKLHNQTKSLEACSPTNLAAMMEPDSCLEKFISVFRDIHKSITKINRINSDIARQYNISNLWSDFDANKTFSMVTSWLRSVNEYSHIMDWDVTETVYFAIAELSRCATRWAEVHSTSHYRWKHWQAKVVLAYAAYQSFGSLLPEMVYKTSDDEETLEDYYHGKVLALYRCGIEGKRAVECIIHGIRDDTVRNAAKDSGFRYPEELLQYLKSVKV